MTLSTLDLQVSLLVGNSGYPLKVKAGSLDMDESLSPFVGGNLTVAHPGTAVLALMTPVPGKKPPRLQISARKQPGGLLSAVLNIQARQVVAETGEVGINLVNDEALVQDYSPYYAVNYKAFQGTVKQLCQDVLTRALGTTSMVVNLASGADPTFTTYRDVRNMIPGGSFEVSSGVWLAVRSDLSISTAFAPSGSSSLRIKPNTNGISYATLPISLTVGQTYTFSAWCGLAAAQSGTVTATSRRLQVNAAVNGVDTLIAQSAQAPNGATAVRLSVTFTVPAGADNASARLINGASNAADNSVYFDSVMLVEGDGTDTDGTPLTFFDGNTPDTASYNYDWDDVAGLSTSTRTALINRSPDALIWQPGTNGIAFLQPILQATGRRLFQDLNGTWNLADNNYRVAGQVRIGVGYGLYSVTDLVSRTATQTDGLPLFADAVILNYQWIESGTGKEKTAQDFAGPTAYTKPYMPETIQAPYPGPGRAAYMLTRLKARQRQLQVTGATNYAARPGMEAVITTVDGGVQTGYVETVIWDLGNDSMEVNTKGLLAVLPGSVGNAPTNQTIGAVSGSVGSYIN